jgi:hypothetical protein
MADCKLPSDQKLSFRYIVPRKEDSMAKFKPPLTRNRLFSMLCQQKKTQYPNLYSTANLVDNTLVNSSEKGKNCFHKLPLSTWFELVQTGASLWYYPAPVPKRSVAAPDVRYYPEPVPKRSVAAPDVQYYPAPIPKRSVAAVERTSYLHYYYLAFVVLTYY